MSGYIDWDAIDRERLRNMPGAEPITDAGRSPAPALSPEEQRTVARFEAAPVLEEAWEAAADHREAAMEVMAWTPLTYDEFRAAVTAGQHPDDLESLELVDAIAAALAAAEQRGRDETARKVRELHVPWYEVNGVRHDNLVTIGCDQHTCSGDNETPCLTAIEFGYHEVPGCAECRFVGEWDGEGYLLWPCPTIRALADRTEATS